MLAHNIVELFSKPRILIVDDVPANLIALAAVLETIDVEVFQANSGNEALQMVLDHNFSLILLDVQMPEMDGFEVATLLRSHEKTRFIPVIFLTALRKGEIHQARGYEVGAVDYLEKPFNEEFLLAKVRIFIELDQKTKELKRQQRKTEITLGAIPDPVISVQGDRIIYMNEMALSLGNLLGHNSSCDSLIDYFKFNAENLDKIQQLVSSTSSGNMSQDSVVEMTFHSPVSRSQYVYEFRVVPLLGVSDKSEEVILIFHDISNLRSLSNELAFQAYHDRLTRLFNRRYFEEAFRDAVSRYNRCGSHLAIILIDIDNFKKLNDTAGHQAGDQALRLMADRIEACLRDIDILCRLGGDEFCVLIQDVESMDVLTKPTQRILAALSQNFVIEQKDFTLGASIGITSTLIDDKRDSIGMLSDADLAMYKAKQKGKNCAVVFDSAMRQELEYKVTLGQELLQAISSNEFCLFYQPQVSISNGSIIGLEALIRWQHPTKGLVPPNDFLPELEVTGMIKAVGRWVIEEACQQIVKWRAAGLQVPCVSVNVSPSQFAEKNFPHFVQHTLFRHQLEPTVLGIEITETLFMESTIQTENNLQILHDMGCKISLDDFGTGYSSLSYLLRFPIDTIKIDQFFIRNLITQPKHQDLVNAVINLGHGFHGMNVISEGVEKISELSLLHEMKCDSYQGYLFSKPANAEVVGEILFSRE